MKQWMFAAAIAFVLVSCDKGNKIYTGPSDNNASSLGNKISVAETFTMTVIRSSGVCAKDSNADADVAAAANIATPHNCDDLFNITNRHF